MGAITLKNLTTTSGNNTPNPSHTHDGESLIAFTCNTDVEAQDSDIAVATYAGITMTEIISFLYDQGASEGHLNAYILGGAAPKGSNSLNSDGRGQNKTAIQSMNGAKADVAFDIGSSSGAKTSRSVTVDSQRGGIVFCYAANLNDKVAPTPDSGQTEIYENAEPGAAIDNISVSLSYKPAEAGTTTVGVSNGSMIIGVSIAPSAVGAMPIMF